MGLMEWIEKNSAEGADLQEAKRLVEGMAKLPETREEAATMADGNQHLRAELDSRISKSVENALKKYEETKLPAKEKELRDQIQKELNPEETSDQKELRELKEWKQQQEKRELRVQKENELMEKAKELGFDPLKAKKYAAFGDDAERILKEDAEDFQSQINSRLEDEIKKRYGGRAPDAPPENNENSMSRKDFSKLPPAKQSELSIKGIKLTDE